MVFFALSNRFLRYWFGAVLVHSAFFVFSRKSVCPKIKDELMESIIQHLLFFIINCVIRVFLLIVAKYQCFNFDVYAARFTLSTITMWQQTFFFNLFFFIIRSAVERSSRPRVWPSATERRRRQVRRGAERVHVLYRAVSIVKGNKEFPSPRPILIARVPARSVSGSFVDRG